MGDRRTERDAIRKGGLYLVTGGLGGIGTDVCKLLAQEYGARLLIVGRTEIGPRETWSNEVEQTSPKASRVRSLLALELSGADFLYVAADVADSTALGKAIATAERNWNQTLDGIFHLAGEVDLQEHYEAVEQHLTGSQSIEAFEHMFRAKVYGTWAIRELLNSRPNLLLVGFSSVNGTFGGTAFGAYSAANSFLDGCMRSAPSRANVYTFSWTMWDDVGMSRNTPEFVREASRTAGFQLLNKEQAMNSLMALLKRPASQTLIGLDSAAPQIRSHLLDECKLLTPVVGYYTSNEGPAKSIKLADKLGRECVPEFKRVAAMPHTSSGEVDRDALRAAVGKSEVLVSYVPPKTAVEKKVAEIWREVLGVPRVSMTDRFFELGGDSLVAMRLVNRLRESFQIELSLRSLFEMPTAGEIATKVIRDGVANDVLALPVADQITRAVSEMSDTDVDDMLRTMVQGQA
jgi:NAD(P)-dependent dehydrogenase (short-subunit alcohol dehydrogenase family)/acyl carrier protein